MKSFACFLYIRKRPTRSVVRTLCYVVDCQFPKYIGSIGQKRPTSYPPPRALTKLDIAQEPSLANNHTIHSQYVAQGQHQPVAILFCHPAGIRTVYYQPLLSSVPRLAWLCCQQLPHYRMDIHG